MNRSLPSILLALFLAFFSSASSASAEVYSYKDANGNVHYVDDPSKIPEEYREKIIKPHDLARIQREPGNAQPLRAQPTPSGSRHLAYEDYSDIDLSTGAPSLPTQSELKGAAIEIPEQPIPAGVEKTTLKAKLRDLLISKYGKTILAVSCIIALIQIVSMWNLLNRAEMPGWGILIPVYNSVLITRLGGYSGWWLLWFFIPFLGAFIWIFSVYYGIARNFGRGTAFAVATALLPFLFIPILAFASRE